MDADFIKLSKNSSHFPYSPKRENIFPIPTPHGHQDRKDAKENVPLLSSPSLHDIRVTINISHDRKQVPGGPKSRLIKKNKNSLPASLKMRLE